MAVVSRGRHLRRRPHTSPAKPEKCEGLATASRQTHQRNTLKLGSPQATEFFHSLATSFRAVSSASGGHDPRRNSAGSSGTDSLPPISGRHGDKSTFGTLEEVPLPARKSRTVGSLDEAGEEVDRAVSMPLSFSGMSGGEGDGSAHPLQRIGIKTFTPRSTRRSERIRRLDAKWVKKMQDVQTLKEKEHRRKLFEMLPRQDSEALRDIFTMFDKGGEGQLDKEQVISALKEMGVRGLNSYEIGELHQAAEEGISACRWAQGTLAAEEQPEMDKDRQKDNDVSETVDLHEFAVVVLSLVRDKLKELRGDSMLKNFLRLDRFGEGKITCRQLLEVARGSGLDQRMLGDVFEDFREAGMNTPVISFEEFQDIISRGVERLERVLRQRERQVQSTTGLDETMFREFRCDIVPLYDIFQRYDADGGGTLCCEEIMLLCQESGLLPKTKQMSAEKTFVLRKVEEIREFGFQDFLRLVRDIRGIKQEQMRESQQACFDHYDKDKSGALSVAEISILLSDVGICPHNRLEQEELAAMIHAADEDGSGTIDFQEFQDLSQRIDEKLKRMRYEQEIDCAMSLGFTEVQLRDFRVVFDSLDQDGNDRLHKTEIMNGFQLMQKQVQQDSFEIHFRQLDSDNSGELDFLEFLEFMRLMRDREGLFADDAQKLESSAAFLEDRVLRRVLEYFRLTKPYIMSLSKRELVETFCSYFDISPEQNLSHKLGIKTVSELYELARRRDEKMRLSGGDGADN